MASSESPTQRRRIVTGHRGGKAVVLSDTPLATYVFKTIRGFEHAAAGSPNPRRVLIFLAEKGLVLTLVPVDLGAGEQHSEAYRAINPRRVVPTLVLGDGTTIGEVPAIMRYLDEAFLEGGALSLPTDVSSSAAGQLSPPKQPELDIIPTTETAMSRTIKFAKAGGPEVLEFIETQVPTPGPREVRIKVKAIGINRAESMWRNDKYIEPVKFPAGLGYDAAGVVDDVGKDVTDFAVGDAVSTIPAFSMNKYFTYGEVILVPDYAVVKHPESLSFVEAASVWMMFITAYGALIFDAQVKAGDFVIIPAASSSVGLAAIQIAKYAGATPIALTRTSDKKKRLHETGAAHVIATQEQDMVAEVMRITNGNGARVAFDPVGGPDFPKLISALTDQGIAYIYGALSEGDTPIPVLEMIRKMPTVKGYSIRLVTGDEARRKVAVEYVAKGLASGALKPVIDRTFKFDDMVEVHRYLENSGQFGKIVVTL